MDLNDYLLDFDDIVSLDTIKEYAAEQGALAVDEATAAGGGPIDIQTAGANAVEYAFKLSESVLNKISGAKQLLNSSYIIHKEDYDEVYVTSDIHADLPRLITLLAGNGLIDFDLANLANYKNYIHAINWLKPRTVLIIVGDIVDGMRDGNDTKVVPDDLGNIELYLHAFIFNIRIKARAVNSEVRFILGNHDYITVIAEYSDTNKQINANNINFICDYSIHPTARGIYNPTLTIYTPGFFSNPYKSDTPFKYVRGKTGFSTEKEPSRNNRRNCLLPFYECCPYLFTTIDNELAFIHGGLFSDTKKVKIHENVENLQRNIDVDKNFNSLQDDKIANELFKNHALTSRYYYSNNDVCEKVGLANNTYKFTFVGHCPTSMSSMSLPTKEMRNSSSQVLAPNACGSPLHPGEHACVLVGCTDPGATLGDTAPKISFVDIAISRCFGSRIKEKHRLELIHLAHNPQLETNNRYYNIIKREILFYDDTNYLNSATMPGEPLYGFLTENVDINSVRLETVILWQEPNQAPLRIKRPMNNNLSNTSGLRMPREEPPIFVEEEPNPFENNIQQLGGRKKRNTRHRKNRTIKRRQRRSRKVSRRR